MPHAPRVLALLLLPGVLAAQTPASVQQAVQSITPEDIRRRIGIIADDSMRGRDTPSPELEKVATYIATEFRRFGLKPGGDRGTFIQRYGIVRKQVDTARSVVRIAGRTVATLKPGVDVYLLRQLGPFPRGEVSGPLVVIAGPADTTNPLAGADVHGAWVGLVATATPQGLPLDLRTTAAALQAGAVGVVLISNRPDAQWQNRLARMMQPSLSLEAHEPSDTAHLPGFFEIRDATAQATLGVDPIALRTAPTRVTRRLDGVTVTYRAAEQVVSRASAPNVVGILEGSDPRLKSEYVFFTGHMDHVGVAGPNGTGGCQALGADSICNGADDDASGTIAVVEAAEAFARLQPRPKRSLVFMTVSGEEKGLWGSEYYADHPTVPLAGIVADLNTDMVGRNWKDTIVVIGKEHSDLGATLNRVGAAHPELNMRPIDDLWPDQNFYGRSDHINFARKGVPILFFFNGTHRDYHQPGDSPDKIDAEKESRIVKLVFYLGLDVANAAERPKWNPDSYKRIVSGS
ncbi:MAG TPA: M20/M25/M40 family metallo-hydrolase [Gemmatimonadales bacterium]|nr:M20/M25/M40 family metallo-hydrolase [Gemmatimonadales bacterium]